MRFFPWRKFIFSPYFLGLLAVLIVLFFSALWGKLILWQFVLEPRYLVILAALLILLNYLKYSSLGKEVSITKALQEWFSSTSPWLIIFWFLIFFLIYSIFFGNLNLFGFIIRMRYLLGLAVILSFFLKIDSRILIAIALGLILTAAFLLVAKQETLANTPANFAYVFLVWGVLFQLIEYFREKKAESSSD